MNATEAFTGRVRVRVNGLLLHNNALLMVKMISPVTGKEIWIPPGGGIKFGESLSHGVVREMREETGLQVTPGPLRYIHEVISEKIHAVELFFDVRASHPENAQLGADPELDDQHQLLKDLKFISLGEIDRYPVVPDYLRKNFPQEAHVTSPQPLLIS